MKRLSPLVASLTACLFAALSLTSLSGCWSSKKGKKKTKIVILTNGDAPFWDTCRKGANDTATKIGLKKAGFEFEFHRGKFTAKEQVARIERYLSDGDVAGLAISVIDLENQRLAEVLKKLKDSGTHVITLDSDLAKKYHDSRVAYIGTNNVVAGRELGKAIKKLQPKGGQYVTFVGKESAANAIERIAGVAEGTGSEFSRVTTLADAGGNEDKEKVAARNVHTVLTNEKYKDVKILVGIWAYNGPMAAREVERKGSDHLIVTFDADPRSLPQMKAGRIKALMVQNPYEMGELAVRTLTGLAKAGDDADALKTIREALPEEKRKNMKGDIVTTGLRIVVPSKESPVKKEDYEGQDLVEFYLLEDFEKWLKDNDLTGS